MTSFKQQENFQALLEEHRKILYKIANSYCRNPADREDLAQEITVQLWRSFGSFDARFRFSTWMYRIALNVAISFRRRESMRSRYSLSAEAPLFDPIDETACRPPEIEALYEFIDSLDPLHKPLVLLYLDGYSYLEMAEILGISETNVATKLSRLKETMRKQLAGSRPTE
jgi:RNA polymerase sigma factor (sigma-70 family)